MLYDRSALRIWQNTFLKEGKMRKVRIVIMGKTGVGKSTIINAVLGEEISKTGYGGAITHENKVYSCKRLVATSPDGNGLYGKSNCAISLYDTVGLEIDECITNETLRKIKLHIEEAKRHSNDEDVHIVWFCINERANRFEDFEVNLIKKLSIEYEIPFVIVLTQCISKRSGKLELDIKSKMPEIPICRIMAEDYMFDDDITIRAFGLDELLESSICDYYQYKIRVIESKIDELVESSNREITRIEQEGKECIADFSHQVEKIGKLPLGCIPIVHGKCVKMISELNDIGGLSNDHRFAEELFTNVFLGVIITPFMAVPFLSSLAASAYIETAGEGYLKAMIDVIKISNEAELADNNLMKKRMKEQLQRMRRNENG